MGSFFGFGKKDKDNKKEPEPKKPIKNEPNEQRKKIMEIDLKLKHYRDKLRKQLQEMEKRFSSKEKEA